jgi:DNA modification methylase
MPRKTKRTHDMQLIHGDCLEEMAKMPDASVDMVLTDPPYGTTACKWDSVIPLEPMWVQLKRIIRPKGAIVFTAQNPFTSALIMSNTKWFKQSLVWAKNKASGHLNANRRHMTKHEDIVLFCSGQPVYNQQRSTGHSPANFAKRASKSPCYGASGASTYTGGNTDRRPTTVLEIPVLNNDGSGGKKTNPTQKPVGLMEYLIKTYSNEGDTIIDFAAGSGTTGVACANLNRNFIGIEKDKKQFKDATRRLMGGS